MIDLSIVTINYNTSTATISCIESILSKTSGISFEIVVVDNGSSLDDYYQLKNVLNQFSNLSIKLIRSKINTGFGSGNMIGYANCKASKYVAFINNDVELIDDCFATLKKYLDKNDNVAIVSPQSLNQHLQFVPTIDHFASWQREIFTRKFLELINPKRFPKRKKQYFQPVEADFIAGSFMFIRRTDFDLIGGFDTNIFLYYEETDISKRLKNIGKKTILLPTLTYKHFHGLSTKKSLAIKLEQKLSLFYIIRKHQGWFACKLLLIFFGVKYFFSMLFKPKKWVLFKSILLGMPLHLSLKNRQKILCE